MDQMSAPEVQSLIGALSLLVSDLQTSRYITAAGFAILIHDHLITLSDEVELIWRNPLSNVSVLFLINRYVVPAIIVVDLYEAAGFARNMPQLLPWMDLDRG
ncbi:hypothetical protein FRB94_005399 [Tulasnella sp. JGI-2019a]|nr:hypothetical protein FRB94_005399 [Tulasnella sp. JGI-2019a]